MKHLITVFLLSILFIQCSSTEDTSSTCYSFDLRQCNGDPWNETANQNADDTSLIASCKSFLEQEGITVLDISINNSFHTVACLACFECPQGPRYYVSVPADQNEVLEKLSLLNFESADCNLLIN